MTTGDYITTTGERWRKSFGYSIEREPGSPVGDAEILAELRALRAQRDELARWRDDAIASCAKRGCEMRDRNIAELTKQRDELLAALEKQTEHFRALRSARWFNDATTRSSGRRSAWDAMQQQCRIGEEAVRKAKGDT